MPKVAPNKGTTMLEKEKEFDVFFDRGGQNHNISVKFNVDYDDYDAKFRVIRSGKKH